MVQGACNQRLAMSAFPPRATTERTSRDVSNVPNSEVSQEKHRVPTDVATYLMAHATTITQSATRRSVQSRIGSKK
jgi:hypothetical protein